MSLILCKILDHCLLWNLIVIIHYLYLIKWNVLIWNFATCFFFVSLARKKVWRVCLDYNINKINWNVNHVQNFFGLVSLPETCFNSFARASTLVLCIVLSLQKHGTIRLVWRNHTIRYKTIIYSKPCTHLHLNNILLPHSYQDILNLIKLPL